MENPSVAAETNLWTRRKFCALGAAALAGTTVGGTGACAGSSPAEFRLNYILPAPMYGTMQLAIVLAEAKKAGAAHIDIWPMPHGNHREQIDALGLEQAVAMFDVNRVRLGAVTRYDLGPYRIMSELPLLRRFGGRLLVCGAGRSRGGNVKEQVLRFVESMKKQVADAEENGVTLGIENHGGTILDTPNALRYFAEFATSPNLGIALAPYHLPQDAREIARLIQDLGEKIVFFQAWEHGLGCHSKLPKKQELMQLPGRGTLDFAPILAALRRVSYRGFTEIFMHPVPRGVPIHETAAAVTVEIQRAREYLDRCLAELPE